MNLDFHLIFNADVLKTLAQGLLFTLEITVFSLIGGLLIGTPLAMMGLSSRRPLAWFSKGYVDFFRGLPLMQVLLIFYFMLPKFWATLTGAQYVTPLGALTAGVITYTIFEAAYFSEIIRAGIQSISKGQMNASYALGMGYGQTMGQVILPQALRNMLPVLLTQTIIMFQDVTMVYAVGWKDFLGSAETLKNLYNRPTEFYLLVALVYFVICYLLSDYVRRLQKKIAVIR